MNLLFSQGLIQRLGKPEFPFKFHTYPITAILRHTFTTDDTAEQIRTTHQTHSGTKQTYELQYVTDQSNRHIIAYSSGITGCNTREKRRNHKIYL